MQHQLRQEIDPRHLDSTTSGGDNSQINTFDSLSNFEAAVAAGGQLATTFHRPKASAGEALAGSGPTKAAGARTASQRRQRVSNGEPGIRDDSTKRQQTREKSNSLVKKSWSQVMLCIVFTSSLLGGGAMLTGTCQSA